MLIEQNMAAAAVDLHSKFEEKTFNEIDKLNEQVDDHLLEMELLNRFLTVIDKDKTDDGLDITSEEDKKLIDTLSQRESLTHIFASQRYDWNKDDCKEMVKRVGELENKYSFDKDAIDKLKKQLEKHTEGPLARKITVATERMALMEQKLNESLAIFRKMLQTQSDLTQQIQRNSVS